MQEAQFVEKPISPQKTRIAVAEFVFVLGFGFSTWASRIPDIKTALHLGSGDLGLILFALPVGQLLVMPFSGKLVTRFGSRRILFITLLFYAFSLTNIGLATNSWQLALALVLLECLVMYAISH